MTLIMERRRLQKIISGGQCGVDQGALLTAYQCGLHTGGTAPKGYRVSGGTNQLLRAFGLIEHEHPDYTHRTIKNIQDADATLIITCDATSPGEVLTINTCVRQKKPHFIIYVDAKPTEQEFYASLDEQIDRACADLFQKHEPAVLNVAGNRDLNGSSAMFLVTGYIIAQLVKQLEALDLVERHPTAA